MSTILSGYGIELTLPSSWYGEIFRDVDELHDTGPTVHLANTPMILGDRNTYASQTRPIMRPDDAIVCVWNMPSLPNIMAASGEAAHPTRGWSLWGASDVSFEGVPDGHSSVRKGVRVGERVFDVVAFFGTEPPPARLMSEIESILATVRIDVSQRDRGERLEQFFSTAAAERIQKEMQSEARARARPA